MHSARAVQGCWQPMRQISGPAPKAVLEVQTSTARRQFSSPALRTPPPSPSRTPRTGSAASLWPIRPAPCPASPLPTPRGLVSGKDAPASPLLSNVTRGCDPLATKMIWSGTGRAASPVTRTVYTPSAPAKAPSTPALPPRSITGSSAALASPRMHPGEAVIWRGAGAMQRSFTPVTTPRMVNHTAAAMTVSPRLSVTPRMHRVVASPQHTVPIVTASPIRAVSSGSLPGTTAQLHEVDARAEFAVKAQYFFNAVQKMKNEGRYRPRCKPSRVTMNHRASAVEDIWAVRHTEVRHTEDIALEHGQDSSNEELEPVGARSPASGIGLRAA